MNPQTIKRWGGIFAMSLIVSTLVVIIVTVVAIAALVLPKFVIDNIVYPNMPYLHQYFEPAVQTNNNAFPNQIIPFVLFSTIGVLIWRFHSAERQLRKEITELFEQSFVLAYHTQYSFIRELLHYFGYTKKLDVNIDDLIQDYETKEVSNHDPNNSHNFIRTKFEHTVTSKEFKDVYEDKNWNNFMERYDGFREKIDESRYNAGRMISKIRIDLGDMELAEQYREYIKHARKTSYHIRRIVKNESTLQDELTPLIISLQTSDMIKINFEMRLKMYSIHGAMFRKTSIGVKRWLLTKFYHKTFHKMEKEFLKSENHEFDYEIIPTECEKLDKSILDEFEKVRYGNKELRNFFYSDYVPEVHLVYCNGCKKYYFLKILNGKNLTYSNLKEIKCGEKKENHVLTMIPLEKNTFNTIHVCPICRCRKFSILEHNNNTFTVDFDENLSIQNEKNIKKITCENCKFTKSSNVCDS